MSLTGFSVRGLGKKDKKTYSQRVGIRSLLCTLGENKEPPNVVWRSEKEHLGKIGSGGGK